MSGRIQTHSLGVVCAKCEGVLVEDNCQCGIPHGHTYQPDNEWARRTWPDHECYRGDQ